MQICLLLFALLLPVENTLVATISGRLLDLEGRPLAGALITYHNIGRYERNYRADNGMRTEAPQMIEGTGRVYHIKADRNGRFVLVGVEYGVYQIEITAKDGSHVYSGKKNIGRADDPGSQDVLNVDLSIATKLPVDPGGGTNLDAGKKSKEQLDLIRRENAAAAKINRLVYQYHAALAIEDWKNAIALLQQLIAIDPQRWEFYQNLGTLQANQGMYQDAAMTYGRGVEVAQKTLANPSDTDHALNTIGDLLLAEADCYMHLDKIEDAVRIYDLAAASYPHPFMAHYRACSALNNLGKWDGAITQCNLAIADDPAQWGPYQLLGGILTTAEKPKDALIAFSKGVEAGQKLLAQKPDNMQIKAGLGQMLNAEGNLYLQMKNYDGAIASFVESATVGAYPAMPYFNLCTIYYNQKRGDEAVAACELAISHDPRMADAYFIKGSVLFGKGHLDHGRYAVPPGTSEALNKYLEFAPMGEHARTVNEMIKQLDSPVPSAVPPAKRVSTNPKG